MSGIFDRLVVAAFAVAMTISVPLTVAADDTDRASASRHAHSATNVWAMARGGQLYDNWMAVLEADAPKLTHPAYPAAGKKKGASTWRCKECHGWDYRGVDGTYAKGSHFTGIKGVRAMVGMEPEKIHKIIMNKTHALNAQMMPHSAIEKLALFLSQGQVDTERYIDRSSKAARATQGAVPPSTRPSVPSAMALMEPISTSSRNRK
ncbi:MAG: hypothetical protein QGF20_16150, partial [Alphaproteobacteria bacterium]|nr:hypothetical protein [Alphaproteobacteria bacterium]